MKQIEVQIMGQGYLLSCPDNGEAMLLDAVSRVDATMCKIRDAGKVKARDRIAVLASLNLAVELTETHNRHQVALVQAQHAATALATSAVPGNTLNDDDTQLTQLIQRLDQALGADDRLL